MPDAWPYLTDREILAARPAKTPADPARPYAYLVEPECTREGSIEDVATLFLTARECPFRCLMCDLWRYTTDQTPAPGLIPGQIDFVLAHLPVARHIKLYNGGSFFDRKSIPLVDRETIAGQVRDFATVIVENHPRLCGPDVLSFRDRIGGRLEVAMGLETIHPEVLPRLNKRMTLEDFAGATAYLRRQEIEVRAFILLRPPFLSEEEGITWALRSIEWAFDQGVTCCSVIPTRAGNGMLDRLAAEGLFVSPGLPAMEAVLEAGIGMGRGRVFMDLWDVEQFANCQTCSLVRKQRLHAMNLSQVVPPRIACTRCA